ncbi:MAG: hypothetical protein ABI670_15625 [Chloroflexota bacterium]
MISPALSAAEFSRRLLMVATGIFVVSVMLGSIIGTEAFLVGGLILLPVWVSCLVTALIALYQSSNSDLGRRTRKMALETLVALGLILAAEIVIGLLTNMLNVRVGVS